MKIDPDSPQWPKQQVAAMIRAQIEAGKMGPRLPSIMELAQLFDISPRTLQAALSILKEEGLIYGVPGRGTFVTGSGDPA